METEMGISAARRFLIPVNLSSLPRIARCHDLRALPEQQLLGFRLGITVIVVVVRCCGTLLLSLRQQQPA
jgi:hypothetical protein